MIKYLAMGALLTSCHFCPTFNYEMERKEPIEFGNTGYHGAHGSAYIAGRDAVFLAHTEDDCTDEEWIEHYQEWPGRGYMQGQGAANDPEEYSFEFFQAEDGTIFILDDEGEIIEIAKLHFFEGEDGVKYIFDDETGEMTFFDFSDEATS